MEKRNKDVRKAILMVIALGIIIYSLAQLYDTYAPYLSGDSKYEELQELARKSDLDIDINGDTGGSRGTQQERKTAPQAQDGDGLSDGNNQDSAEAINFGALGQINSDIVAWIKFEEPSEIDYPIVQGSDNQEYLTRTFDEDGHKYGTIFMDVDNSPDFTDRNTFIYGHHMRNGSMFAGLLDYLEKSYYEKHPFFTIHTLGGQILTYQVCSVEITAEGTLSYRWKYDSEESWEEYLDYIMNNAGYRTGVILDGGARLVSLSTCLNTTTNQRVLLHGVLRE